MATGPYKIESFDPTTGLELSANPNYWGGKVTVKHISVKFFATDTSMALAFRAGEIDVAFPQYNLAKARAELAQSPWPHGFTATTYNPAVRRIHP